MPFQFDWLYEDKIAHITATGNITLDDVIPFTETMLQFLESSSQAKVHFIDDMSQVESANFSLPRAGRLGKAVLDHEKFGWLVVYGMQNSIASIFVGMVSQLFRQHVRSVKTFEDTLKILKRVDLSLPDLSELKPPNVEGAD